MITRALAPVKAVVASARRITTDNLSHRIPAIHSDDEIGQLVNTFNGMINRLDSSITKIKRFSSDVAHEFKTPMTVMLGEIDVLMRKERPLPEYIETLTSFREEVVILQKIIENLLFLDSSESDIGPLTFFDISLHQVVLQVIESIEHKAVEKKIAINFGRMDSCIIHGEVTLLKRAFFNLVENACKYTPQKGKMEISLHHQGDSFHFSVTDSGVGIAPEHLPNIFDRFFRVEKSRRRSKTGSGLGLCLTRRIIQLHNGDINVVSSPGKGSTFTVTLPLSPIPKSKESD
ncbi:MAG: HAMP domain-containing protein [bacterium]|nr:HAMP domain-containing protein [bacterium]